jgi:hypothetical protein
VCAPCWGMVGGCTRRFVNAPSGRHRLNGLAAVDAITDAWCTVEPLTDMTAATVWERWRLLAGAYPGRPSTSMLDKARDQRGALVPAAADALGMAGRCWPTSAPTRKRSARFGRFVNKPCRASKDSPESPACQQASFSWMHHAPTEHRAA